MNKLWPIETKCLALCTLLFPVMAFIKHAAMVTVLCVLFVLSLTVIKKAKITLSKMTKLLISSFVILFLFSIPNMIMDSLYAAQIKASSLDVPSRYLAAAVILVGLSQLRLKVQLLFIGNILGIFTAFIIYPVWAGYILGLPRYFHPGATVFPEAFVGVLAVAYMSIVCMMIALISTLYFHTNKNSKLTLAAIIAANLASITMVLSGSKVILLAYPLIPLLIFMTWRETENQIKLLLITPIITAMALILGKDYLLILNVFFITPYLITIAFKNKLQSQLLKSYNIMLVLSIIAITITAVYAAQKKSNQELQNKLFSGSVLQKRIKQDIISSSNANTVSSTKQRIYMWKSGWASFVDSPILGQGYEERRDFHNHLISQGQLPKILYSYKGKGSLHNELINTMAKKGIVGLIAILILYFFPIVIFYSQIRKDGNYHTGLSGVFIVLSFMISGLTESLLMTTFMSSFYVLSITLTFLTLQRPTTSFQGYNEK